MTALHLACAADEKYLPHCGAMLHSVFEATTDAEIVVHFLHLPDFPSDQLSTLSTFVREAGGRFDPLLIDAAALEGMPSTEALPLVVWQRVLLPELLPDLDKVLYLDSDLVALRSIKPLWDLDISGHYLAAVSNPMHDEMAHWPETLGLPNAAAYFNSGVMLLNLALLREHGAVEKVFRQALDHPELVHWGDQCAMNVVLHAGRYPLDPRWNVMNNFVTHGRGAEFFGGDVLAAAIADPQVIHFEGPPQLKPWHYRSDHPYRALYLRHRQQTPWPLESFDGRTVANIVKKRLVPKRLLDRLRSWRRRSSRVRVH